MTTRNGHSSWKTNLGMSLSLRCKRHCYHIYIDTPVCIPCLDNVCFNLCREIAELKTLLDTQTKLNISSQQKLQQNEAIISQVGVPQAGSPTPILPLRLLHIICTHPCAYCLLLVCMYPCVKIACSCCVRTAIRLCML